MQGNLYTFGCSFSNYVWPMWPNIMSQNYNVTKNYGHSGCGNFYIFYKATELLTSNKVKNTDTVIIQWTEPSRTDYINVNNAWPGAGNLTAELLIKSKLDFLISDKTSLMKTLTYMVNTINLLESIGCKWYFMHMTPQSIVYSLENLQLFIDTHLYASYNTLIKKLLPYKYHFIDNISMIDFYNNKNMSLKKCFYLDKKNKKNYYYDDHPLPSYTLKYIKEVVSLTIPNLNITKMEEYVTEVMKNFDDCVDIDTDLLKSKFQQNNKLLEFKNAIESRNIDE